MKILSINPTFTAQTTSQTQKHDILNEFYDRVKNPADMTDTILVPRTIFKGYLGIMTGTVLVTLGGLLNKHPKLSKFFTIPGLISSLYGTYAFVRPYVLKGAKGVETKLPEDVTKS